MAHEITSEGSDRGMLSNMAIKARTEMDVKELEIVVTIKVRKSRFVTMRG